MVTSLTVLLIITAAALTCLAARSQWMNAGKGSLSDDEANEVLYTPPEDV